MISLYPDIFILILCESEQSVCISYNFRQVKATVKPYFFFFYFFSCFQLVVMTK